VFTQAEAMKKECRQVPMLLIPGQIAGQVQVVAPNCSADSCAHWRWLEAPSALDPNKGRGGCARDHDIALHAFHATVLS
jgi:hypothetical protein